jgi:hypothetical protein
MVEFDGGNAAVAEELPPAPEKASGEGRRGRAKRKTIPVPEGGFTEFPAEYDPQEHNMPKEEHFADPRVFLRWQAQRLKTKIEGIEASIRRIDQFGSGADAAKAAKQMARLEQQLAAFANCNIPGLDVNAMLQEMVAAAAAKVGAE